MPINKTERKGLLIVNVFLNYELFYHMMLLLNCVWKNLSWAIIYWKIRTIYDYLCGECWCMLEFTL